MQDAGVKFYHYRDNSITRGIHFFKIKTLIILSQPSWFYIFVRWNFTAPQCADGESNRIVSDKEKIVTIWMFNTYWVRNHFVPNPINSKFIRLKKFSKNIFLLQQNIQKVRTNKKNLCCSTEIFNLTAASQLVSWTNSSTLFNYFVKKAVTF